jgi:hypothetical protein
VLTVYKSVSLNLLEPYGPVQACNGIALAFYKPEVKESKKEGDEHFYHQ